MTDHHRWHVLAATSMDSELGELARGELETHLHGCAACRAVAAGLRADAERLRGLDFGMAPERVRGRVAVAAHAGIATRPSLVLLFAAALLVIAATFAIAAGAGALLGQRNLLAVETNGIHWQTDVVDLQASDFWIDVGGQRYFAIGRVAVHSDPGHSTYWTLEATWQEHGQEQRVYIYFAADGREWSVTEVRTYDGAADPARGGAWVFYVAPQLRAPLGQAFVGDVTLQLAKAERPATRSATLHFGSLRLSVNPRVNEPGPNAVPPAPGVVVIPADGQPVIDGAIEPVSLSNPGRAAAAIDACHVREFADRVVGMGRLARGADAVAFLRAGEADGMRNVEEPVWLVLFEGRVRIGDQDLESPYCLSYDDGRTMLPLARSDGAPPKAALPPLLP